MSLNLFRPRFTQEILPGQRRSNNKQPTRSRQTIHYFTIQQFLKRAPIEEEASRVLCTEMGFLFKEEEEEEEEEEERERERLGSVVLCLFVFSGFIVAKTTVVTAAISVDSGKSAALTSRARSARVLTSVYITSCASSSFLCSSLAKSEPTCPRPI